MSSSTRSLERLGMVPGQQPWMAVSTAMVKTPIDRLAVRLTAFRPSVPARSEDFSRCWPDGIPQWEER